MDLYDDHEYWRCENDAMLEEVDPEEEEEDPEVEDQKGGDSVGDNKDESFTGSNITP